ncbi:hypothetical protein DRQ09_10560, partial [candidate division KSB1 bacterium]
MRNFSIFNQLDEPTLPIIRAKKIPTMSSSALTVLLLICDALNPSKFKSIGITTLSLNMRFKEISVFNRNISKNRRKKNNQIPVFEKNIVLYTERYPRLANHI